MRAFYIETDRLTQMDRNLRYVFSEDDNGKIRLVKIIDPANLDEVSFQSLIGKTDPVFLISIQTAYLAYKRVYFQ